MSSLWSDEPPPLEGDGVPPAPMRASTSPQPRITLAEAFRKANAERGSRIKGTVEVLLMDPVRSFKNTIMKPKREAKAPPRLKLSAHFVRLVLLLFLLYLVVASLDDYIVDVVPKEYDIL